MQYEELMAYDQDTAFGYYTHDVTAEEAANRGSIAKVEDPEMVAAKEDNAQAYGAPAADPTQPPGAHEKDAPNGDGVHSTSDDSDAEGPENSKEMSASKADKCVEKSPYLKAKYSAQGALVFFLIAAPFTYQLVQGLLGGFVNVADAAGCAKPAGLILHTIVFFGLLYVLMSMPHGDTELMGGEKAKVCKADRKVKKTPLLKIKYSIYSALVFFLLANPVTYKVVQNLIGGLVKIADTAGCPTLAGVGVHSVVYFLVLYGLMALPKDP